MNSLAILVGNTNYTFLEDLPCCGDDLAAVGELLNATQKYSEVLTIGNTTADDLKSRLRSAITGRPATDELYFYFTGHGFLDDDDFYYCSTHFDPRRPNETGISNSELHALLRIPRADLVIKIIDACRSGIPLIKSDSSTLAIEHETDGFKRLIQISSCLASQNSQTGNPLSLFTANFRAATLRKTSGAVYYLDIVSTLRDTFRGTSQTPHFVYQVTGEEVFVDDAKKLDQLREELAVMNTEAERQSSQDDNLPTAEQAQDLKQMLQAAETNIASPERISTRASDFFDKLSARVSSTEFSELFTVETVEHTNFAELSAKPHIIDLLSKEKRLDKFVTIHRVDKGGAWQELSAGQNEPSGAALFLRLLSGTTRTSDETYREYRDNYDIRLNCEMDRAQMRVTLTPRFRGLRQLVLVASFVPSLAKHYLFAVVSQYRLVDFDVYEMEGDQVWRHCAKAGWNEGTDSVVDTILTHLDETIKAHYEQTISLLN